LCTPIVDNAFPRIDSIALSQIQGARDASPPETPFIYCLAGYYPGSTIDAPTVTAKVYIDLAQQALDDAVKVVDNYRSGELDAFSQSLSGAGIGLFTDAIQP
jgi:hypothetical protein